MHSKKKMHALVGMVSTDVWPQCGQVNSLVDMVGLDTTFSCADGGRGGADIVSHPRVPGVGAPIAPSKKKPRRSGAFASKWRGAISSRR